MKVSASGFPASKAVFAVWLTLCISECVLTYELIHLICYEEILTLSFMYGPSISTPSSHLIKGTWKKLHG